MNYAIDINTHNARLGQWGPWIAANDPTLTKYDYSDVIAGFQAEEQYIVAVNAAAAPELNRVDMVFGGLMALAAAPASIPLIASGSATGAAVGGLALAADLNHASGIGAAFTGQDRLALDYVFRGASDGLDRAALVGGFAHGAWSLRGLITSRSTIARAGDAATDFRSGSFSISDWSGYPAGVSRPQGPFRLLEGAEYTSARNAANNANAVMRREQGLVGQLVDVHEIQPVKFGGSPTDPANKVILLRDVHRQQVTPWWNQLQKGLGY